jgi:hypothetical protein
MFGPSRAVRRRFWLLIRAGVPATLAGVEVGVSRSNGTRWFVQAGGMPSLSLVPTEPGPITISFPPIVDDDEKLTKDTIQMLLDNSMTTGHISRVMAGCCPTVMKRLIPVIHTPPGGHTGRLPNYPASIPMVFAGLSLG